MCGTDACETGASGLAEAEPEEQPTRRLQPRYPLPAATRKATNNRLSATAFEGMKSFTWKKIAAIAT